MTTTPTQNNAIINRLMGAHADDAKQAPGATPAEKIISNENDVLITTNRVVSIRYKIYFLVFLLLGAFFAYNYVYPSYQNWQGLKFRLIDIESQTSIFESRKNKHELDKALIQKITAQEKAIVNYFNTDKGLQSLDKVIQNNLGVVRSFLQLSSLYNPKMLVDERVILANMNEFLFKYQDGTRQANGSINKIEIGEPELFDTKLYHLPIVIQATFNDKDGLMSFINNVEKYILEDTQYRILYKINEITYDIVNYDETQEVEIVMSAYYFRDDTQK